MASNINISAGNPAISTGPHIQRGQWKKGLAQRKPWRPDFYDPVEGPQAKLGRRRQESRYWCLINLNKTYGDEDNAAMMSTALYDIVHNMKTNPRVWVQIFEFGAGKRQPEHVAKKYQADRIKLLTSPKDIIESISVDDFVVERGQKKGRVHCHFKFEVIHYSQLRLNFARIPDILGKMWGEHVSGQTFDGSAHTEKMTYGLSREGKQTRPLFWARLLHERNFEQVSSAYNMKDAAAKTVPMPRQKRKAPDWASSANKKYTDDSRDTLPINT